MATRKPAVKKSAKKTSKKQSGVPLPNLLNMYLDSGSVSDDDLVHIKNLILNELNDRNIEDRDKIFEDDTFKADVKEAAEKYLKLLEESKDFVCEKQIVYNSRIIVALPGSSVPDLSNGCDIEIMEDDNYDNQPLDIGLMLDECYNANSYSAKKKSKGIFNYNKLEEFSPLLLSFIQHAEKEIKEVNQMIDNIADKYAVDYEEVADCVNEIVSNSNY